MKPAHLAETEQFRFMDDILMSKCLASTGTQYIDTGLIGAWGDVWQGSFRFTMA